jgi:hypothetical protein
MEVISIEVCGAGILFPSLNTYTDFLAVTSFEYRDDDKHRQGGEDQ